MLGTPLCGLRYWTGVLFRHCVFAFVEGTGKELQWGGPSLLRGAPDGLVFVLRCFDPSHLPRTIPVWDKEGTCRLLQKALAPRNQTDDAIQPWLGYPSPNRWLLVGKKLIQESGVSATIHSLHLGNSSNNFSRCPSSNFSKSNAGATVQPTSAHSLP